ncbi:MAG: LptF/LptG family permease, partial [Bacteroidales bacterium]|nr:LptF/LptG family permease [Bacteroidales bacterium]
MKGLTKDIKGLTKERNNKIHQTARSIITSQIFRYEDKKKEKAPFTALRDSLAHQRINYDSLFETYTLYQKQRTANYALNLARTTQSTLRSAADEYQIRSRWIHWHEVEWHRKITIALACIIFFLIGAPLGAIIRKGGLGTPVVVSVIFFIFYYIITLAGEKYAKAGVLPVWLGMWGSSFILLIAGIYLTIKSTRDSAILRTETYSRILRKVLGINGKGKANEYHENSATNQ